MASASTVFQYWMGPLRKVELLMRTPSTSSRFCRPVKPRMKGEPWPWAVFCTSTPGVNCNASGSVRRAFSRMKSASR